MNTNKQRQHDNSARAGCDGSLVASAQESTPGFFDQLRTDLTTSESAPDLPAENSLAADLAQKKSSENNSRRALVSLLRLGVIMAAQKAKLFAALCQHQTVIRRHLAEVYLKLILDEKTGLAFVANIQKEEDAEFADFAEDEIVSLITRRTLSLYDTLLLLVLRKHYQERENAGEQRVVVDLERLESYLTPFLPLTNSSKSDRRKLNPALKKMVEKKILRKAPGSDGRYEITPVIRYVVSAEFLETMLAEYLKIANENNITRADTPACDTTQQREDDSGGKA